MCGIAGLIAKKASLESEKRVKDLLQALKHRGPDGEGIFVDDNLAIGMCRLAIIDVEGGNQPIFNEDKNLAIVGNGEIYNYFEIQEKLKAKGHTFSSGSDIETIIHLYEEKGLNFLDDLVGMFAFALFDKKRKELIIARDRYGEKPVYYTVNEKEFLFSSELKAIIADERIEKTLNKQSITEYLKYNCVLETGTMFSEVKKLEVGTALILNVASLSYHVYRYFDFDMLGVTENVNLVPQIKEALYTSCKICLRSDVPVGVALSGGIDSSAILAIAKKIGADNLVAFSVGYSESSKNDESCLAEEFSKSMKIKFIKSAISTEDFVREFPRIVFYSDEPIADIAAFPIYMVSSLARKNNVSVLLNGLGGDEIFWGYPWVAKLLNRKKLPLDRLSLYDRARDKNSVNIVPFLLTKEYKRRYDGLIESVIAKVDSLSSLGRLAIKLLRKNWLISNCINLSDRMGMANSVEIRSPLLDINLTNIALTSEENLKAFNLGNKYYFRKALEDVLPPELLNRPKKGFTPPVFRWLKELNRSYIHLLEDGFLVREGIVSKNKIKLVTFLWRIAPFYWVSFYKLILLEIWGREFIYKNKYEEIAPYDR